MKLYLLFAYDERMESGGMRDCEKQFMAESDEAALEIAIAYKAESLSDFHDLWRVDAEAVVQVDDERLWPDAWQRKAQRREGETDKELAARKAAIGTYLVRGGRPPD